MTSFSYNPLENESRDTLHLGDHESYLRLIRDQYETPIAYVLCNPELEQDDNPRAEQIAHLFAAAPELFDVLKQTLRSLAVISPSTYHGLLGGKIRTALANATGKLTCDF